MTDRKTTVDNIGVGPLPDGQPGATLVISLSDGSVIPVFLGMTQARELAQQIFNTLNPRFPSGGGLPQL